MNWLKRLFRKPPAITRDDPVFGRLTFCQCLWATVPFGSETMTATSIAAPETGPSDAQRNFFVALQLKLPALAAIAREYVAREADGVRSAASLDVYSLGIGTDAEVEAQRFVLELIDEDEIIVHEVTFEKDVPVGYTFSD